MPVPRHLLIVALLALAAVGCGGGSQGPPTEQEAQRSVLSEVAELYRVHQVSKNAPPKSIKDFTPFEQGAPQGYKALKDGMVVVYYAVTLPDTGEGFASAGADEVLAYEKQVPESGGMVLMLNRSIKSMTADEFKAVKKAGN